METFNRTFYLRFLWILAFISGLTFVWQDVSVLSENPVQLSSIHKVIIHLILGFFLLPHLLKRPLIIFKGFVFIFVLFSLWCALSALWSVYPVWTLYRSIEYFIFMFLAVYSGFLLRDFQELKKLVNIIWLLITLLVISVWIGLLIFPERAMIPSKGLIPFMLNGVFPRINPNTVSHIGGIISIIGINRFLSEGRKKWTFLILLGLATIILSQGRSGMLAFGISAIFLLFFHKRISLLFMIMSLIFILISYSQFESIFYQFISRGQKPEILWGLGGRIYKWEMAKTFISEKPFLGYGAFAGSRFFVMPRIEGTTLSSSTHSAWVELTIDTGLIGVLLYGLGVSSIVLILLKFIRGYKNNEYRNFLIEMLCILILLIVRSIFTTAVLITPYDLAFLAVLTSTVFFKKYSIQKKHYINNLVMA